jgi:hypothetical protein
VLDRASRGWRGLTMTPKDLRLLQDLRHQLLLTAGHRDSDHRTCHRCRVTSPTGLRPESFTPLLGRHLRAGG